MIKILKVIEEDNNLCREEWILQLLSCNTGCNFSLILDLLKNYKKDQMDEVLVNYINLLLNKNGVLANFLCPNKSSVALHEIVPILQIEKSVIEGKKAEELKDLQSKTEDLILKLIISANDINCSGSFLRKNSFNGL